MLPPMGGQAFFIILLRPGGIPHHLRKEVFGFGGVFLNLAADVGHVDPEDLIVSSRPGAPQLLDDGVVGQHFSGVFAQQGDDPKLTEGEMDVLTSHQHLVLVVVNGQLTHRVRAFLGDFTVAGNRTGVADGCTHPGKEFIRAERFGQIVICAQVQSGDFVFFRATGPILPPPAGWTSCADAAEYPVHPCPAIPDPE